jgi:hypothetical protein
MTEPLWTQLLASVVATSTPWLVVAIVRGQAGLTPQASASKSLRQLRLLTIPVMMLALVGVWLSSSQPWISIFNFTAFALLAFFGARALGELDAESRHLRIVETLERTASLKPRRASDYLPWQLRACTYAIVIIGLTLFVLRLFSPDSERQLLVPSVYAFASLPFLLLYEVWIQQVTTGPAISVETSSARTRQLVRRIFAAELILVIVCVAVGHVLLGLSWTEHGTFGATLGLVAGVIGIIGCALALSSAFIGKRYGQVG